MITWIVYLHFLWLSNNLVGHFVKKFLEYDFEEIRSDETKENILIIMKNDSRYRDSNTNVNDRKVDAIQKVLLQVLDPENLKDLKLTCLIFHCIHEHDLAQLLI